ncbi:MAG TPA: biosynthetic peptidoglycan transglycosylase [Bacteroidia bacterium]|nr:biosynthetic peptidoglycan transglycosylase [Bacteroidia bacterium]
MPGKYFFFRAGLFTGYLILGIIVLYFLFRGLILDKVIGRVEAKLLKDFDLNLTIEDAGFSSLSTVSFSGVKLKGNSSLTIFEADSISIKPSLASLLSGEIKVSSFFLSGAGLFLTCDSSACNYSAFLRDSTKSDERKSVDKKINLNYAAFLNKLLRRAFNFAPQVAQIRELTLEYKNDSIHEKLFIPFYDADEKHLEGVIEDSGNSFQWKWSGTFSQKDETFDIIFFPLSGKRQSMPLLNSFLGLECSLDTIHLALYDLHYTGEKLDLKGHFSSENLRIFHKKISQDTVVFKRMLFDADVTVMESAVVLDSSSSFQLNSIKAYPYIKFNNSGSKVIDLKLKTDPTQATDFFFSLPEGMFEVVRDVEAEGTLEYSLNFHLDSSEPDSVLFNSEMKKSRFHLGSFGEGNLAKIRGPFQHSVYENDRLFRVIEVGPDNPYYTPIDSISPLFQSAVLTSEDGNFYYHQGFNEEAFRKSIATNFKAGSFRRGGSTISMQLVKNVYLTRKKTVARKAEEALIVWLLENNRVVSKSRMFEVYLNIIELGPGIYGIAEASEFYFSKKPSQLDLAESIFLANLLPHPKWYRSSFDADGRLKPHLADYYRLVSNFMLKKNLITQEQFDQLKPEVTLNGPAREKVVVQDSLTNGNSAIPLSDESDSKK